MPLKRSIGLNQDSLARPLTALQSCGCLTAWELPWMATYSIMLPLNALKSRAAERAAQLTFGPRLETL